LDCQIDGVFLVDGVKKMTGTCKIFFLWLVMITSLTGCGGGGAPGCRTLIGCDVPPGVGGLPAPAPEPDLKPEPSPPSGGEPSSVRQLARIADSYAIYYGALDANSIQALKQHPLVIVHPHNGNIVRSQIREIQNGRDPNSADDYVVVLCYISIGEDSRTFNLTDAQLRADPRFTGDGTGPSTDPRGVNPATRSLVGVSATGKPTQGGFASWYLNDNANYNATATRNVPDQNPSFLTRYVNAGDPRWYDVVNNELADSPVPAGYPATPPGLKEMLTTTTGRGLGCDGVFLDTMDTAAPNAYAPSLSNFEWTAKGFTDFILRVRQDYPDKVILQNRGIFFFDPREPHYEVSARGSVDLVLLESYRMDSDPTRVVSDYFTDNKFNYAPKLMAEANRADGFKVISLDYVNGWGGDGVLPKPGIDILTLTGGSSTGLQELQTNIDEALSIGFRPYLTDAPVTYINPFVERYANLVDTLAPVWSSTHNVHAAWPATAPEPRVGIQKAVAAAGNLSISWDVALDMNRVKYVLYFQTTPFDFATDPKLTGATRVALTPSVGTGYAQTWDHPNPDLALQNLYPYQQSLTGLAAGKTYYLIIRAIDSVGNEDNNQVVLSVVL